MAGWGQGLGTATVVSSLPDEERPILTKPLVLTPGERIMEAGRMIESTLPVCSSGVSLFSCWSSFCLSGEDDVELELELPLDSEWDGDGDLSLAEDPDFVWAFSQSYLNNPHNAPVPTRTISGTLTQWPFSPTLTGLRAPEVVSGGGGGLGGWAIC